MAAWTLLPSILTASLVAASAEKMTCGMVKSIYRSNECCGAPSKELPHCEAPSFDSIHLGTATTHGDLTLSPLPLTTMPYYPSFFSTLVIFGDSNVDSGLQDGAVWSYAKVNDYPTTGDTANYMNTAQSTQYKAFTQFAAELMHVPMKSYGIYGSWSGEGAHPFYCSAYGGAYPGLCKTYGTKDQVKKYIDENTVDEEAVFLFMVGSNDIFSGWEAGFIDDVGYEGIPLRSVAVVESVKKSVMDLKSLGAKTFVIANRAVRPNVNSEDDENGRLLNAMFKSMVREMQQTHMDIDVYLLDVYSIGRRIQGAPKDYGVDPAKVNVFVADLLKDGNVTFQESLEYPRYDGAHMGTIVHRHVARELVRILR